MGDHTILYHRESQVCFFLCLLIRIFSVGSLTPALVIPRFPPQWNKWGIKAETSRTEDCDGRGARGWQQLTEIHKICIFFVLGLRKYNTHSVARLDLSFFVYCHFSSALCCDVKYWTSGTNFSALNNNHSWSRFMWDFCIQRYVQESLTAVITGDPEGRCPSCAKVKCQNLN